MILESIVTTKNEDGTFNVAPMGPHINDDFAQFELKPFKTSTTYENLRRHPYGVLHVTDNALWFAKAVIGTLDIAELKTAPAEKVEGLVLPESNRWLEFSVVFVDENRDRSVMKCQTVVSRIGEPFWGFNRAKHAILECAILATRVSFLPGEQIQSEFKRFETIVGKTGGAEEIEAFELLQAFVSAELKV